MFGALEHAIALTTLVCLFSLMIIGLWYQRRVIRALRRDIAMRDASFSHGSNYFGFSQ